MAAALPSPTTRWPQAPRRQCTQRPAPAAGRARKPCVRGRVQQAPNTADRPRRPPALPLLFSSPAMASLCCECGVAIEPNPAAMCSNCIRTRIDITEGIPKQVHLFRPLFPPPPSRPSFSLALGRPPWCSAAAAGAAEPHRSPRAPRLSTKGHHLLLPRLRALPQPAGHVGGCRPRVARAPRPLPQAPQGPQQGARAGAWRPTVREGGVGAAAQCAAVEGREKDAAADERDEPTSTSPHDRVRHRSPPLAPLLPLCVAHLRSDAIVTALPRQCATRGRRERKKGRGRGEEKKKSARRPTHERQHDPCSFAHIACGRASRPKVRLIDAGFIWTEPHSKRIKLKLTIQKEVRVALRRWLSTRALLS